MDPRALTEWVVAAASHSPPTPPRPQLRNLAATAAERRMESGPEASAQVDGAGLPAARRSPRSCSTEDEAAAAAARRRQRAQLAGAAALRRMEAGVPAGVEGAESPARLPPRRGALEVESGAPRPPRLLQRFAAALRGPFARVVDAVLYAFLAAVWVALLAGNTFMVVGRWAGGAPGSTLAAVGRIASWVAVRVVVLLAPTFVPLFVFRWRDRQRAQAVVQDEPENHSNSGEAQVIAEEAHRPETNEIMHKIAKCVNPVAIYICIVLGLVIFTGILMKLVALGRGSGLRIIGSVFVDTGFLICSALSSLIIVPNLVLELRRAGIL